MAKTERERDRERQRQREREKERERETHTNKDRQKQIDKQSTKCSTWKLGHNGQIWPFLRSFWLFYKIFFPKLMPERIFLSGGYMLGEIVKKNWFNISNLAKFKAISRAKFYQKKVRGLKTKPNF